MVQGDGVFRVAFMAFVRATLTATARIKLNSGESWHAPIRLVRGFQRIVVEGESAGVDDVPRTATLGIEPEKTEVVEARAEIRFGSTRNLQARLDALRRKLPGIRATWKH